MNEQLQVLYFSAPWCGPCKIFKPAFQEVVKSFEGEINVVMVDVDETPEIAQLHTITSIPTIIMIKGNDTLFRNTGVMSKLHLTEEIEKYK